jgi:beta-phosphoglucomutase-like phosphatase (HAD superfamily)
MADKREARVEDSWAGIAGGAAAGATSARPDPHRKRNLRIAIRQLERAELYLVALYSLDLDNEGVEAAIDDLVRDLRGLRGHLVRSRLTAV